MIVFFVFEEIVVFRFRNLLNDKVVDFLNFVSGGNGEELER